MHPDEETWRLQVAQLAHENRSSIEVTRNAKSERTWAIKLYGDQDTPGEMERVAERVKALDDTLKGWFGL